jgi:protein SCO1
MRTIGLLLCLVLTIPLFGQEVGTPGEVGVEEHSGQSLPLDLVFRDEGGAPVKLGSLIDRPTVLMLVFFRCPAICRPLMQGIAEVVDALDLVPGRDYRLLTVSFDEADGPDQASESKAGLLGGIHKPFPAEAWRFLTGEKPAIAALTAAAGFRYQRVGMGFNHPAAVFMISPAGKITRTLYGIRFLPFDLKMGLVEAGQGRVGPSLNRLLLFCYSYDPQGRTYAFSILKVSGLVILFLIAVLTVVLVVLSRRRRRGTG